MRQTTIANSVELVGIGLHKGVPVKLVLEPLKENQGIVFYRSDLGVKISLKPENIVDTKMATVLGNDNARISTIEHLLSSINAYGIDNIKISVDNEEIPIMDGSALTYCMLLDEAGIRELDAPKQVMRIKRVVEVKEGDKFVRVEPDNQFSLDFSIKFEHPIIAEQSYSFNFSKLAYKDEIAKARTFGFLQEVNYLRSIGLAKGGSLNNCIVLDENSILNKEGLRCEKEFVRHKILDAMGDLMVLGMPMIGKYTSFSGSHKLNSMLVKAILADSKNYEVLVAKNLAKEVALQKAFA
ncbi:UDP-3-O-acyl-N-acetylglucosamine deacetylase [Helicobacter cetorum]|uniref:UDP-3-O-acyl-N-acetylglucosamine deacetylase n=1 Tax=Helicobacter cetorum (strain ATCC BAA-540 / CCUG 52418 / MIT 99-5656) TaxID=1163745 RepID=I0EUJ5_HELCM|nr:UDP-3-O-acyl-N-acetylglucosamine deacetylase [Helicobacter cetorum]AFI06614.1 UDP-3-O-[3-hydroxymyristoyl] N-acetylglucosamine deacetylase [Helicobacter cetorum MIT 99-5656]